MTELQLCPFCGGEATSIEKYDYSSHPWHWIECTNCDARTDKFLTEKEAIEAWNKRVPLTDGFANNVPPTNEQWFCSLPTEEKVEWLTGFVIRFIPCELTVLSEKIKTYKNDILKWLKEAHNG